MVRDWFEVSRSLDEVKRRMRDTSIVQHNLYDYNTMISTYEEAYETLRASFEHNMGLLEQKDREIESLKKKIKALAEE